MKEIIDLLKKYTDGKKNTEKVEVSVLNLNRIIKALELTNVPVTNVGDLISRETVTHYLTKARLLGDSRPMKEIFAEILPVEPERKTGNTLEQIRYEIIVEADYHDEYVDADIAKGLYKAAEIINKHMRR